MYAKVMLCRYSFVSGRVIDSLMLFLGFQVRQQWNNKWTSKKHAIEHPRKHSVKVRSSIRQTSILCFHHPPASEDSNVLCVLFRLIAGGDSYQYDKMIMEGAATKGVENLKGCFETKFEQEGLVNRLL